MGSIKSLRLLQQHTTNQEKKKKTTKICCKLWTRIDQGGKPFAFSLLFFFFKFKCFISVMTPDELRFYIMSRVGSFGNLYMFAAEICNHKSWVKVSDWRK